MEKPNNQLATKATITQAITPNCLDFVTRVGDGLLNKKKLELGWSNDCSLKKIHLKGSKIISTTLTP